MPILKLMIGISLITGTVVGLIRLNRWINDNGYRGTTIFEKKHWESFIRFCPRMLGILILAIAGLILILSSLIQ